MMEPEPVQDVECGGVTLDVNNANSAPRMISSCTPIQKTLEAGATTTNPASTEGLMTSPEFGRHLDVGRLMEFNRELTTRYANLQAQFAELVSEHNRLQYRQNMMELATLQNSQGDGPQPGKCGEDTLLAAQYRADLRKMTSEKETVCHQATQLREDLRQTAARLGFLQTYVSQLQQRLVQRDRVIQKLMQERALNVVRDVHTRMLHNELLETRGGIRVVVRYLPTAEEFSNIEIVNSNFISIRKPLFNFAHLKGKAQAEHLSVFNIHSNVTRNAVIFGDVRDYIEACVDGNTAAIIANGPKGTGKTHTMVGPADDAGIIPRALSLISQLCTDRSPLWEFKISLSAIQIVDEEIYDLLTDMDDKYELRRGWFAADTLERLSKITLHDNGSSIVLKNVTELEANTEDRLIQIFCDAWQTHSKSSHIDSAHFIVLVRIKAYGKVPLSKPTKMGTAAGTQALETRVRCHQIVSHGFLILCDLVSFDRPRTKRIANNAAWVGKTERQSINVNDIAGTVLGRVFEALRHNATHPQSPIPVPYRDSKLTHLLKPALLSEAKCAVISTISLRSSMFKSTYRTLQLSAKAVAAGLAS
ncbi:kinesin protein KIFC3 [Echinococcus multilocularis]|uniref:Kinesin protein KIFC3 n=1 Tax=Echinococcus multilocularis TaxID=6211 RepID=A0A068YJM0_ECHMU|nr:kinesin protein KIFC3 [Echinococcus multilocularis]